MTIGPSTEIRRISSEYPSNNRDEREILVNLASGQMEGIGSLLLKHKRIGVPIYQRNYSWSVDQVQDFLNDLFGSMDSRRPHFLGCLILQDAEGASGNIEIVDGQQRLTTVFLVLARIQDELSRLQREGLESIPGDGDELERYPKSDVQQLIFNNKLANPRFLSNPLIEDMFREKILNPGRTEDPPARDTKQKAITLPLRKAFWLIEEKIQERVQNITDGIDQLRYLDRLLEAVKVLQVLCITTKNQEESLEVFLTLNNRGLPLGPSDIIRGQLVQALTEGLPADKVKDVHRKVFSEWQRIMKLFDDSGEQQGSIDQFFRYYLLATGTTKIGAKKAPKEMDTRIRYKQDDGRTAERDTEERRKEASRIWKEIQMYSTIWVTLLQPSDLGEDCEYHLRILRNISDNYRVLLLNVFRSDLGVTLVEKTEVARLCVVLTMRWYLDGQGAQDLETEFQGLGRDFLSSKSASDLIDALKELSTISPPIKSRFQKLESQYAKAILHGVDRALAKKEGANPMPWTTSELHVEHIAPETSTEQWIGCLFPGEDPAPYLDEEDRAGTYDDLVERMGNKTLLDKRLNIRAQQDIFKDKKPKYESSSACMTRDLKELETWSIKEIESREEWLIEMFNLIWSKEMPEPSRLVQYSKWRALPKAN